jgi:hypothetical protein
VVNLIRGEIYSPMNFLSQITKGRIIKALALLLALWLVECARNTYQSYQNIPIFEGSSDAAINGDDLRTAKNILDIRVSKVENGKFYGTAHLHINGQDSVEKIKSAKRIWIELGSLSPGPPMSLTSEIYLSVKNSSQDEMMLASGEQENFMVVGDTRKYPYDKYLFAFTINVMYTDGVHTNTLDGIYEFFHLDLPSSYRVRAQRDLQEYLQFYATFLSDLENQNRLLSRNEFLLVVDRPDWFKWLVISLVSFLLVTVIIVLRTPLTTASIDLIASVVSIVTIRTWFFGTSTTVFRLDFIFGGILLAIGLIQLTKVVFSKPCTFIQR